MTFRSIRYRSPLADHNHGSENTVEEILQLIHVLEIWNIVVKRLRNKNINNTDN